MKFSPWAMFIATLFTTCLITANIVSTKLMTVGPFTAPAGIVVFPLSYLFGDILTEVYGYTFSRRIIWTAFFCNAFAVLIFVIAGMLPSSSFWTAQPAYNSILGVTPRLLAASFSAYLVGEFTNSFLLAKLKIFTKGRFLWVRTIGSTLFGEGIDTLIFIFLAFTGLLPLPVIAITICSQWAFKVLYEVIATPVTYLVVNHLKRVEQCDVFDRQTNFSPFAFFEPTEE